MIKKILLFIFFGTTNFLFSQNYAYSFNGQLSIATQDSLTRQISELNSVSTCTLKYKPDSQKGEFLIYVDVTENKSKEIEFSPAEIKALFIEFQLEPLDFRKIK